MEQKQVVKQKKVMWIIGISMVLVVAIVLIATKVNAELAYSRKAETYKEQLAAQMMELKGIESSINALLDNSFLQAAIQKTDIDKNRDDLIAFRLIEVEEAYQTELAEEINGVSVYRHELGNLLDGIYQKFNTQTAVNALFQSPALTGKITAKKPVLAKSTDKATYEKTKKAFYQKDTSLDEWQKAINSILEAAETQLAEQLKKMAEKKPSPKTTAKASSEDTSISKVESTPVPVEEDNGYYEESSYEEPVYTQPAYEEPSYEEPTYKEPTYVEPEPQEPAYQEPSPPTNNDNNSQEEENRLSQEELEEMMGVGKGADVDSDDVIF